ncbi:transcriptional regulator, TetR family [Pseudonocardia thermophila]|jgi:Bacterial regulatory proteins, tetR family.|uniref:Transcriptional regulator, TetR family n=2 Tax=Pseudonocardia thermophila TaxID=1848 RepID=A0A1M7B147_PSETH|nr:transcriptional regulator, TetR family [Pseudonocardia thermophila]
MAVFWRHGYRDASIGQLTEAMGVTPPSLYGAFTSKSALFIEAAQRYLTTDGAAPAAALTTAPTARAAVEAMLLAQADLFTRPDRPPGCLLTRAALTCPADEPDVAEFLARATHARLTDLQRVLRAAADRGEPIPFGPRETAALVDTVVQGMAVRAAEGATRRELRRTARRTMQMWDAAVAAAADPAHSARTRT